MKRYEIRWASLDPTTGSEMAKRRPVVIVSRDELNARLNAVTICPLTNQIHPTWRTRVGVRVARKSAEVAADHIRTISKERLGKKLGDPSAKDAAALRRVIAEMYAVE
ncbi:MAG: type II toxin-antitoxin system PemK/MazF family toxin [Gemmatimonadaceae bacterium]